MRAIFVILLFLIMPLSAHSDTAYKQVDLVVTIPNDYFTNPNTGEKLELSTFTAENEIKTAINIASDYFKPLKIKLNIVKIIIPTVDKDPYKTASTNNDPYGMLQTAISLYDTYQVDYDIGIVVGKGQFQGKYGLTFTSVSCTNKQNSQIFVTTYGLTEQKQYSLAHTIAHEIGHVLGMGHDDSNLEGQSSIMAANFVAKPYGFSSASIARAQNRINGEGGDCLENKTTDDSDFDGFTDEEEQIFGSRMTDHGSRPNIASNQWYSTWNSFLDLINIAELINRSDKINNATIKLRDISGKVVESKTFALKPFSQFDVILNEWSYFKTNSYGTLEIIADDLIDGRLSLYSVNNQGDFKFSTAIPFMKSMNGVSNASFNTYYPYSKTQFDYVQNWLTLVNLDDQIRTFRVTSFDSIGEVIKTKVYTVYPHARLDVDGGHELMDITRIGMQQIVPENTDKPYIAYLSRFGFSGNKNKQSVKFANIQLASSPIGSETVNTVIKNDKSYTYLEVVNSKSSISSFYLKLYSSDGELLYVKLYKLSGFSQIHLPVSEMLNKTNFGSYQIIPTSEESIVSQLYSYQLGEKLGEVITANLSNSEMYEYGTSNLSGSYNLFLNANNYIFIANHEAETINIEVTNAGNIIENINIPANSTKMLSLRDLLYFSTKDSSYGAIEINSSQPAKFSAFVLRQGSDKYKNLMLESNFR